MNKTVITPVLIFAGIAGLMALMAGTHVFTPVVTFIHNWEGITPIQALGCLLFAVAGFWVAFTLLNMVCGYFVPRIDARESEKSGS